MSGNQGGSRSPRGPVLLFREARDAAAGMARLRGQQELTQRELAGRLDCPVEWVRSRERTATRLTQPEAEKIAAALGTDYLGLLAAGAER